jgi:uncharacterized FlaG/YvyC family protein
LGQSVHKVHKVQLAFKERLVQLARKDHKVHKVQTARKDHKVHKVRLGYRARKDHLVLKEHKVLRELQACKDHLVLKVHREHQVQWLALKDRQGYKVHKEIPEHKAFRVQQDQQEQLVNPA